MKKIIRLTEEDLNNHIKRLIIEKTGVPENILETAEQIYYQVINKLQDIANGEEEFEENFDEYEKITSNTQINGNYRISDFIFTKIKLMVVYIPTNQYSKTELASMGSGHGNDLNFNSFKITYSLEESTIILRIVFLFQPDNKNFLQDAVELIKGNSDRNISTLSHELLHSFSNAKRKGIKARKESEYLFYNNAMSEFVHDSQTITKFLINLYYLDQYENLTRPSEIASQIRTKNITKSQFRSFLENNDEYIRLKEIRDYTYDDFRRNLWNDIKDMPAPPNMPPEKKFNKFLEYIFVYIKDGKIDEYKKFLTNELTKQSMLSKNIDPGFNNFINNITDINRKKAENELQKYAQSQYGDENIDRFFENTIKMFNFVAGELLKRISKLYDMAKDDTKPADVHSKINAKTEKLNEQPVNSKKNNLTITKEDILAMRGNVKDVYWNTKK